MGWFKHVTHSISHAFKHPMKSLEGEIHRENKQIASAVNVGKLLQGVGLAPKPPAQPEPDTSTADALRELAAQQAQQQQQQQQQEQAAQQQAQQQQQQAAQQAQQAQEQARQEALRRKKMSSLLATSPSGLSTSLLGSAASAYGKPTLGG
ncbi:TPA: hypothetical protein ACIPVM_000083 [Salmonella enterica subsp. diarizonae serovar 50:k:z35]|nr:hypothetical protein [Salmonella enterica]HEC8456392.1 hypothetical protein [Salmonella enterica subsp. enterica serovar Poona]